MCLVWTSSSSTWCSVSFICECCYWECVCISQWMQICGITLRFSFQNKLKNFKVKITEMKCCVTRTDFEIKSTNVWGRGSKGLEVRAYINHIPTQRNKSLIKYYWMSLRIKSLPPLLGAGGTERPGRGTRSPVTIHLLSRAAAVKIKP